MRAIDSQESDYTSKKLLFNYRREENYRGRESVMTTNNVIGGQSLQQLTIDKIIHYQYNIHKWIYCYMKNNISISC